VLDGLEEDIHDQVSGPDFMQAQSARRAAHADPPLVIRQE
jgi:hypothetical protein